MNKQEFLARLGSRLTDMPREEKEERLLFYSEMIDDRIEEGLSEEEAVAVIGSVDGNVMQILAEKFVDVSEEKPEPAKKRSVWNTLLLILGSPVWLSLLVSAFTVVLSLLISAFAVAFSVLAALWAVIVATAVVAVAGIIGGIWLMVSGNPLAGTAVIGVSLVCAGLNVFLFYGGIAAAGGFRFIIRKTASAVGKRLAKRRKV